LIRIGSRGSALALWQAGHIKARLMEVHPGLEVEIEIIHTTGDRITDVPLSKIGDKGLFTKELDNALLDHRVDLAVHSLKDVPTRVESGLVIAAITTREDPSDAFVTAPGRPRTLMQMPAGSRIGTSSLRRRAQLLALRPDLIIDDLRGNLDTRLAAVAAGRYDAAILALSGMKRLGRDAEASEILDMNTWLPAVGQGALGIVTREDDLDTRSRLSTLDDPETHAATSAERALLRELEGGCQIPIGALAQVDGERLFLRALVASIDGTRVVQGERYGERLNADELGISLAHELLDHGAGEILAALRNQEPGDIPVPPAP
jgi:hydroxymethylbilane synthase